MSAKNTTKVHLESFYHTFPEIQNEYYDGCIITGAPVEHLAFEDVDYWEELQTIMEWTKTHVFSTMHICWGALAGLYYHFGIPKYDLSEKDVRQFFRIMFCKKMYSCCGDLTTASMHRTPVTQKCGDPILNKCHSCKF